MVLTFDNSVIILSLHSLLSGELSLLILLFDFNFCNSGDVPALWSSLFPTRNDVLDLKESLNLLESLLKGKAGSYKRSSVVEGLESDWSPCGIMVPLGGAVGIILSICR